MYHRFFIDELSYNLNTNKVYPKFGKQYVAHESIDDARHEIDELYNQYVDDYLDNATEFNGNLKIYIIVKADYNDDNNVINMEVVKAYCELITESTIYEDLNNAFKAYMNSNEKYEPLDFDVEMFI